MAERADPGPGHADAELAEYVRTTVVHLVRQLGSALVWAAAAMAGVAYAVWGVSQDFPGRLLVGITGVLVAGLYLRRGADRVPRP